MSKKWYAVYVNSRHEKKVASLLDLKVIENYLPVQKVLKQWSDRKKVVEEPLFRSYIFVYIDDQEKEIVRETAGVVNFVYWLGKPAIIREDEIETIKNFLVQFNNIEVKKEDIQINSHLRLDSGPFTNQIGKVTDINNNMVKIFIESLGFYLIADLSKNKVLVLPTLEKNDKN